LELENQKQRSLYVTATFVIVLLALILLAIALYYRITTRQKLRLEAETRRQEVLRYEAVIQTLEKERNRIANELHDNTGALISFIASKTDFVINNKQTENEDLKTIR